MAKNRSLLIIYTGGTIGMMENPVNGSLQPFDFESLSQQIPVLDQFDADIAIEKFDPLIDSSNVTPGFWIKLVDAIERNYDKYDGFVILHGTDTMSYTASALSFLLENLGKPVVLTGSQLPLSKLRTDGRDNLVNAIEIALATEHDKPLIPEVSICFENKLLRGNRTNKFNAENFDAFLSGNYPLLAQVGVHIKYNKKYIMKQPRLPLVVHKKLDTNVAVLKLFPGITEKLVTSFLNIHGLKGVILETFGSGNAPTDDWFIQALKSAIDRGIIIFNVTQCKGGAVEMGKYETSRQLEDIGIVGGFDITTESAVAKMMYLLTYDYPKKRIKELLQKPLRGELSTEVDIYDES